MNISLDELPQTTGMAKMSPKEKFKMQIPHWPPADAGTNENNKILNTTGHAKKTNDDIGLAPIHKSEDDISKSKPAKSNQTDLSPAFIETKRGHVGTAQCRLQRRAFQSTK